MSEEQQQVATGTTGPADAQAIGADPSADPATDPTAAPGPDDAAQPAPDELDRDALAAAGVEQPGVNVVNGDVTQPDPYMPGYGNSGKFPSAEDAGEPGQVVQDVPDDDESGPVTSEPASEADQLVTREPAPVTSEPAADADQLDVPADQRGDTA